MDSKMNATEAAAKAMGESAVDAGAALTAAGVELGESIVKAAGNVIPFPLGQGRGAFGPGGAMVTPMAAGEVVPGAIEPPLVDGVDAVDQAAASLMDPATGVIDELHQYRPELEPFKRRRVEEGSPSPCPLPGGEGLSMREGVSPGRGACSGEERPVLASKNGRCDRGDPVDSVDQAGVFVEGSKGAGVRLDSLLSEAQIEVLKGLHRDVMTALVSVFVTAKKDPDGFTSSFEASVDVTRGRMGSGELTLMVSPRIVTRRRGYAKKAPGKG